MYTGDFSVDDLDFDESGTVVSTQDQDSSMSNPSLPPPIVNFSTDALPRRSKNVSISLSKQFIFTLPQIPHMPMSRAHGVS